MYIAFKWLVFLAFTMWMAMCMFDLISRNTIKSLNTGIDSRRTEYIFKNKSVKVEHNSRRKLYQSYHDNVQNSAALHLIMFIAGALAVTAFHKKREIITFAHRKMAISNVKKLGSYLKETANNLGVAISLCLLLSWEKLKIFISKVFIYLNSFKMPRSVKQSKIHILLLNKLKEMGEERKNLGQLLISAIHENKNIRMRYQLETMTKNRLMQHIEDTQKHMKENRSRYMSFQQLYLVTHQENVYLKARLGKLKREKDDAEKNLMKLINEIYRSQNKELKAYCSRFIVKTKEKILNTDVNAEIEEFLEKSRTSNFKSRTPSEKLKSKLIARKSWPMCARENTSGHTSTRVTEIFDEEDSLVPIISDAPRLRGLPGEYVWTVKDKNGIIEKIYEYDYEADLDNGETIRRIRQYSVYCDKECLLDFSKMDRDSKTETSCFDGRTIMDHPLGNQRIVTGSKAFQNFLLSNKSIVLTKQPNSLQICE